MARANCSGVTKAILEARACGVRVAKSTLETYQRYDEIVEEVSALGVDKDVAYNMIHISHLKRSGNGFGEPQYPSIFGLKRDSPIRKQYIDYLFNCVLSKKESSRKGMYEAAKVCISDWTDIDYDRHYTPQAAHMTKINQKNKTRVASRAISSILSAPTDVPHGRTVSGSYAGLTQKQSLLTNLLSPGQMNILIAANNAGYGDSEYAALCIAIKHLAERLETEKMAKGALK
jgi:hypothetical protein